MKNFLKPIKMISEAREQGKSNPPSKELLFIMIVYMIATFASNFIYILISFLYYLTNKELLNMLTGPKVDYQVILEKTIELFATAPEWINMIPLFLTVFYVIGTFIYCKTDKRSIATLGIRKANIFTESAVGLLLGFFVVSFIALFGIISGAFTFGGFNRISVPVFVAYVFGFLIYAFSEELLIRGCYMVGVAKKSTPIYAIFSSAVFYALIYFMNFGTSFIAILNQFLFGIIAGLYVFKRGNIWGAVGFNFAVNFALKVVFGFNFEGNINSSSIFLVSSVKGFDSLNGGIFGAEAGLFMTLALFILFGLIIKFKQNEKEICIESENENEKGS